MITQRCISIDIVLATSSNDPTSLDVSNDSLCSAGDVNFTVNGGSLGTLANWELAVPVLELQLLLLQQIRLIIFPFLAVKPFLLKQMGFVMQLHV